MRITVRYFAALREVKGVEQESIDVEPGTTLGGLYQQLFGATAYAALPVACARNLEYARAKDAVGEGDEVAFLPPIGGG